MLWIPTLSTIIFFLFTIPLIIIGYKKGWRYALVMSLILFILTLIFAGINIAIYKKIWWLIYKEYFIKKENLKFNIDLDILSQYYKKRIVLTTTGLLIPFIYLFTWIIMTFTKNKLEKYLGNKTQKTSNNYQKKIIFHQKIIFSKVAGGTIIFFNSIFSSSFIASAANTIITPYNKTNSFTIFNDHLGEIYSLGLFNNAPSPEIINIFLKKLNKNLVDKIREFNNFDLKLFYKIKMPNINIINSLEQDKHVFKELFKYNQASEAIFNSIINNKTKLNLLLLDEDTKKQHLDENHNQIGFNQTILNDWFILNVINYFRDNLITFHLPKIIKQTIYNKIISMFQNFENSAFFINWINNKEDLYKAQQQLLNRQNNLKNLEQSHIIDKDKRKSIIQKFEKITGIKSSINNFETSDALKFQIETIDRNNIPNREGSFKKELAIEQELQSKIGPLEIDFNKKTQELSELYNKYVPIITSLEKNKRDAQKNFNKAILELKKQEKVGNAQTLNDAKTKVDKTKKALKAIENKLKPKKDDYRSKVNQLQFDLNESQRKFYLAKQKYDSQKNNVDEIISRFNHDKKNLNNLNNVIKFSQEQIDSLNNKINRFSFKQDATGPATIWHKHTDNNSIYFQKQFIVFIKIKLQQIQLIKNIKEELNNKIKQQFSNGIKTWLQI